MSTKQLLVQAIEAMPETLTVEEAVERLYRAFKQKHAEVLPSSALSPRPEPFVRIPDYTLEELLGAITPNNLHDETATGVAVGAEAF